MSDFNNDLNETEAVAEAVEVVAEPIIIDEVPADVTPEIEEVVEAPVVEKKAKKEPKAVQANPTEKVALFSERNIAWQEAGKLLVGYNLVTKELADKWLTKKGVRLATPEEIATRVKN